jgi:hypothetical protein
MRKRILNYQVILACLLITLPRAAQAADENRNHKEFIFDRYGSPHSSSSMIISSRALLNEAEDFVFCTKHAQYGIWSRIVTTVLNSKFNRFLTVVNHEVNGHGFRARSLGVPVSRYSFTFTLLGLGGAMHYRFLRWPLADEQLLISMGGTEANSVLAQKLLFKNFKNLSLDSRTYELFYYSYYDLTSYILLTFLSKEVRNTPGNDISSYIKKVNGKYNTDGIDVNKLTRGSLVFFLNPILYIALWADLNYLFTGKDSFTIPHLKLGNINYMPLIRMGLTPFGLTYYLENYIGHGNKTFLVSIDGGNSPFHTRGYGGIRLQTDGLWLYKSCGLDVTANLWRQPKLQLNAQDQLEDKNYWGGLIGIDTTFKLGERIALNASILYKDTGFVEGIVANSGPIFRGGFSLYY